eukprot:1160379-Pelagomonas_calceolata.AAC.7
MERKRFKPFYDPACAAWGMQGSLLRQEILPSSTCPAKVPRSASGICSAPSLELPCQQACIPQASANPTLSTWACSGLQKAVSISVYVCATSIPGPVYMARYPAHRQRLWRACGMPRLVAAAEGDLMMMRLLNACIARAMSGPGDTCSAPTWEQGQPWLAEPARPVMCGRGACFLMHSWLACHTHSGARATMACGACRASDVWRRCLLLAQQEPSATNSLQSWQGRQEQQWTQGYSGGVLWMKGQAHTPQKRLSLQERGHSLNVPAVCRKQGRLLPQRCLIPQCHSGPCNASSHSTASRPQSQHCL